MDKIKIAKKCPVSLGVSSVEYQENYYELNGKLHKGRLPKGYGLKDIKYEELYKVGKNKYKKVFVLKSKKDKERDKGYDKDDEKNYDAFVKLYNKRD